MTDDQIRAAVEAKEIVLEPFDPSKVEPASYDIRVGNRAFSSKSKDIEILSEKILLTLEPGEFAVIECREHVRLDAQHAAMLGLRSEYAQRGLLLLSGPQIDPGWGGIIVVRVVNLAPRTITLLYQDPFLTAQFF